MKKRKIIPAILLVVAMVCYSICRKQNKEAMSDILLANIEALASDEGEGEGGTGATCTVSLSCGNNPNDYISCSGIRKCTRGYRRVICDGLVTEC